VRIERKTAGNVTILELAGAIDADGVRALDESTDAVVEAGCRRLVFSLGAAEFFDSRVVTCLTTASKRLKGVKGKVVVSASSDIRQMLQTLGLAPQLKVFPDDRAALAHFGEDGDALGVGALLYPRPPSGSEGAWPEEHPRPRP
jgi:anti-anti-sigma factor